jgi:molecular chaperone DnaK
MPIVQRYVEQLLSKKAERGVDPMEAVALGAAIQAGVLTGEVKDILLLDVTPLTLSIETLGGIATPLIERNTTIPVKKSQVFTTADDFQTSVDIHIVQGERSMAKDNIELGKFSLTGIAPAKRGAPQIEVTFDIDANGILHVTAKDKATGKAQGMDIVAPHKMSKDDIEKRMEDAKKFEEIDKKIKEEVETRNEAESLVYTAEKTAEEYKDKVSKEILEGVAKQKESLQDAIKKQDMQGIKDGIAKLKEAMEKIGDSLYKSGQGAAGNQAPPPGAEGPEGSFGGQAPPGGGPTDADFKVEK